jgi:hypothetical protein
MAPVDLLIYVVIAVICLGTLFGILITGIAAYIIYKAWKRAGKLV